MAAHRAPLHLSSLAVLFGLVSLGAQQTSAQTPIRPQADSSRFRQGSPRRQSAPKLSGTPAARELFGKYCIKCHGADGTGREARDQLPEIPDFTTSSWQGRRRDSQLLVAILDGKGQMPSWRAKIGQEQASGLVAHVRSFASAPGTQKAAPPAGFHERFHSLEKQFHELEGQARKLSKDSPGGAPSQPSQSPAKEGPRLSASAAAGNSAVRELFRKRCVKCHGSDGTGSPARDRLPEIPDFTKSSWQARRKDAQLLTSILDGKDEMPSWRDKISEEQVRSLIAHVRAFAPHPGPPKGASPRPPGEGGTGGGSAPAEATLKTASTASPNERNHSLEKEVRQLQTQNRRLEEVVHELQTETRKLAKDSPGDAPAKPRESQHHEVSRPPGPTAAGNSAVHKLFRQRCLKCHGADGTGSPARGRLPKIPDFTKFSWQARRSDAQLLASILDGKDEMPRWRDKVSEEQARGLMAHVRAFASTTEKSGQRQQEGPASAELTESEPPSSFLGKLIRWLGGFHPPAVHFPIALLTVAAVAELLRLVPGRDKRALDAVSRYCVGFGVLTAVVAGMLGWFLGGFQLTDASWVKTTHRWLGTCTVASAGLVFVLSERSRHPDRHRSRIWYRVTLFIAAVLVSVTGFFGGALVFGLKHYSWPR
jgi:mono/diheme cytochrome c family protein/uncharacterized membrane protein